MALTSLRLIHTKMVMMVAGVAGVLTTLAQPLAQQIQQIQIPLILVLAVETPVALTRAKPLPTKFMAKLKLMIALKSGMTAMITLAGCLFLIQGSGAKAVSLLSTIPALAFIKR